MHTELVTIETGGIPLDGAFYRPTDRAAKGAVMLFHGNTMNFYTGAPRFLPPALVKLGFACLAFNRRGHDILSIRNSRATEGAAHQTTAEAIADNRIAARWMAERGFPAPVIIGHSNGGMLAVQHVHDHPHTPALVLLSAHRGDSGAPLFDVMAAAGNLAQGRTEEVLATARAMVAEGRGDELMLTPGWWYVISAASYVDRMTTMPAVVELAPLITCPVLFIRGDQESPHGYPAEEFQARAGGPCDVEIIEGCDHFYNGREAVVSSLVCNWLNTRL